jgi:hypothetical protein
MPRTVSRSIRYVFAAFTVALLLMAGVQSFGRGEPRMGLSTCGWDENPCMLEGIVVTAAPVAEPQPIATEADVVRPAQHVAPVAQTAVPAQS